MMNSLVRKYWYLTAIAVLLFASASFAQTLTLTGVGTNPTVEAGVYVDPYNGTFTNGSTTVSTLVICDDWFDNSSVGPIWNVNVGTISSGTLSGTPLFTGNGITTQTLYQEVAFLATLLLQNNGNGAEQAGISFALWELTATMGTYPNSNPADSSNPLATLEAALGSGYASSQVYLDYVAANTALNNAVKNGTLVSSSDSFEILTPNPETSGEAQEFLVKTPESSATVLLGADLFGLLGLAIVFRRRLLRPIL
jgi:hypothetical protein